MQRLNPIEPNTIEEMQEVAKLYAQSRMFSNITTAAQAFVIIQAGRAWGIGAFASLSGMNMVHGKPEMSAGLMSSRLKQYADGRYTYTIKRLDQEACELEFFDDGKSVYVSSFTIDDARRANIASGQMWNKYRRNMLFARALSNGARWIAPDAFGGPVYAAGEISEEGNGLSADGSEKLDDIVDEDIAPDPREIARDTFPFADSAKSAGWSDFFDDDVAGVLTEAVEELGYTMEQFESAAIGTTVEDFPGSAGQLWLAFAVQIAEDRENEDAE